MLESLEADGSAFPGAERSAFGMGRGPCDKACARIQPPERFSPGNAGIRDAGHQEKEIKFVALLHLCRTGWGVRGVYGNASK